MPFSSKVCDICGEALTGCYWVYEDNTVVCSWCKQNRKKCEICGKPISGHYYSWDNHVLCEYCYEDTQACYACGRPLIGKYIQFNDGDKICSYCYSKRTEYNITISEARKLVNYTDIEIGQKLLKQKPSFLCVMDFSITMKRLSNLLKLKSSAKLNYMSNSYYFCSREIRYMQNTEISPVEAIIKGVGNCSVKSALLASLLKCYSLTVRVCTTNDHAFVITYFPSAPKEYRMFRSSRKSDGTSWADWIGMDPASECIFGRLPEKDFTRFEEHVV